LVFNRKVRKGLRNVRKEKRDVSDQSTGGARHGGRRVASATDGIKTVKDISELMSACERSGSAIIQKGTTNRATSQTGQVFSEWAGSESGSE
jgi:hypothetical protein